MKNQRQPSTVVFSADSAFSPLAPLWAAVSERGLWAASYGIAEEEFRAQILDRGCAVPVYAPEKVRNALWQMEEFLAGNRKRFDLKVDWRGMTPFQIAVRKAVRAGPYGQDAAYRRIAAAGGPPPAP